jgi:3-isopropylmalate dehydrogenase
MTTVAGRGMTMPVACLGDRRAMFRPDHGPMPGLVGINRANPVAAILAGSAALDHIGMTSEGRKIRDAVKAAYGLGYRTADDGGDMGTYELTDRIISLCENAP